MNPFEQEPLRVQVVPTQAGYDGWAAVYDEDDNPLVRLEERHLRSIAGDLAGLEVADIGCGTGRHALPWAAAGARVTAVDFSQAMLERARSKPGAAAVKFIVHDIGKPLPIADGSFDRVFSCLVVDHIGGLVPFFMELRRLCRPAGWVIISTVHPAMLLRGVQARFIDPVSGQRIGPESYPHQTSDFLMAAIGSGLQLDYISEHAVDASLAAGSPRAQKYSGWPLLLLMRFKPSRS